MRYWTAVLLSLLVPTLALAQNTRMPRPLDAVAAETLRHATERSAIIRGLINRLESSNVIVHIETVARMPSGIVGMTRFVASRGAYRYVRITLGADTSLEARSSILGHELQHACEIAGSPASDVKSLRELFEGEGYRSGQYFETMAAIQTERNVRVELSATRVGRLRPAQPLQAEPVVKFDH